MVNVGIGRRFIPRHLMAVFVAIMGMGVLVFVIVRVRGIIHMTVIVVAMLVIVRFVMCVIPVIVGLHRGLIVRMSGLVAVAVFLAGASAAGDDKGNAYQKYVE